MSELTRSLRSVLDCPAPLIHDHHRWYDTGELRRDADTIGRLLDRAGVRPGQPVVVAYPNSYAFAAVYAALLLQGIPVAPVNPAITPAELATFLERSGAVCGFFTARQADVLQQLAEKAAVGGVSWPLHTAFVGRPEHSPVPMWRWSWTASGWLQQAVVPGPPDEADTDARNSSKTVEPADTDIGVMLYTSGTTGRPKCVGLQHRHLLATARQVVRSHELTPADVTYCFLPLFHINAQVVALLSTWLSGGRVVIEPKFSASRFWAAVAEHGITWVSAVPTVIAILLRTDGPERAPVSLRFVRSASAQLPALHQRSFERRFQVPVIQSYGMTEAASQICVNPIEPGAAKAGSVGLPCGVELRIVDGEDRPLPPGRVGEVAIRGASVIDRYEDLGVTDDFRGGWFHTGDLGYVDEEGFVFLTGRKKEMINRAGEKVSPYEVEDAIRAHPAVAQVAVIGLPDPLYGERIAAYVVLSEGEWDEQTVIAEIYETCDQTLSRFKRPSEVEILPALPAGPTGKVQRHLLKQTILARQIS
ncbi:MAG: AMP-binding protein [Alicyclobacillus sp.]|nr:AMP-binding protein [Alicyclobacillus sp.]